MVAVVLLDELVEVELVDDELVVEALVLFEDELFVFDELVLMVNFWPGKM